MYWSAKKLKSYNLPLMIVFGGGGCGKTYNIKNEECVKYAIENKRQFIWLVSTDDKVKELTGTNFAFANDCPILDKGRRKLERVREEITNLETSKRIVFDKKEKEELNLKINELLPELKKETAYCKGTHIFYNNEEIGQVVNINLFEKLQGNAQPLVDVFAQDEMLKVQKTGRNINLIQAYAHIVESFGRTRKIKLFGMSNMTYAQNEWSEHIPFEKMKENDFHVIKVEGVRFGVVEFAKKSDELKEIQEKSTAYLFNKLAKTTRHHNEFLLPRKIQINNDDLKKEKSYICLQIVDGFLSIFKNSIYVTVVNYETKDNTIFLNNFIDKQGQNHKIRLMQWLVSLRENDRLYFDNFNTAQKLFSLFGQNN